MISAAGHADRNFGGIRVSTADWPILVVEFPEKRVPDTALGSALGCLESFFGDATKSGEQLFVLTDISSMREITPASQRKMTAEWMKRIDPVSRVATVGGATVTPSPILRGIMTAIFWLQPSSRPIFMVATRHEGMLKGIHLLEQARVRLPPRLVAYRDRQGAA
jgi:hypothetical protein